jgi:iron complex outermembrane receptor protein
MSETNRTRLHVGASLLALAIAIPPAAAFAQTDAPVAIEEVIVTAQKREESLQEVPMTVEVVTGETLERNNLTKFQDVALLSPGLELNLVASRQQVIQLRGVQFNPDSNAEATVQVYLNDSTIPASSAFRSIFDLGQIEVLRGAQGALRGRTSPSGAITMTTRRPDMNRFEGFVQGELSDIDLRHVTGAVSIPFIPGVLSMRLAGDYNDAPSNTGENGNFSRAGRVTLDWTPTDRLDLSLMYQQLSDRNVVYTPVYSLAQCLPGGALPPGQTACTNNGLPGFPALPLQIDVGDRYAVAAGPAEVNAQQQITQLTGAYDLGDSSLFFTGSYQRSKQELLTDQDPGNFRPGWRFQGESYKSFEPYKQVNAELRWQSTDDDAWQYMYGLFYSKNDTDGVAYADSGYLPPSTLGGVPAAYQFAPSPDSLNPLYFLRANVPFDQGTESYAAFTAHSFKVTERDTLAVALRYQRSKVRQDVNVTLSPLHVPLFPTVFLPGIDIDTTTPGRQTAATCEGIPANRFGGAVVTDTAGGQCALRAVPGVSINNVPPELQELTFEAVTGSASWTHAFTDDINGYVSYSRSHRPGGVTIGNTTGLPLSLLAFDEETSDSFEIGMKSTLLDGRLRVNGGLFYQRYENYINRVNGVAVRDTSLPCNSTNATFTRNFTTRPDPTGVLPNTYANTPEGNAAAALDPRNCVANAQGITFNGDAVSQGAELQIDYLPIRELRLGLNAAYAKAEYVDTVAPCTDPDQNGVAGNQSPLNIPRQVATGQVAQFCDRDGTKLSPSTPPWSVTLTGEYTRPMFGLEWFGRAIYQYKPKTTNTDTDVEIDAVNTVNLYAGVRPERANWELQLYVKNALDEDHIVRDRNQIVSNGIANEPTGYASVSYGPGREVGVSLRYEFGS